MAVAPLFLAIYAHFNDFFRVSALIFLSLTMISISDERAARQPAQLTWI